MTSGEQSYGFTIIEVLIVLAIGLGLLLAVIYYMSSDQNQTEFDTGLRQIYSQLQNINLDVSEGNYPTNSANVCTEEDDANPQFGTTPSNIGANLGCVFIGKVIQFMPNGSNATKYYVYSIVGNQFAAVGSPNPPSNLLAYDPIVLNSNSSATDPPAGTQTVNLPNDFSVSKVGGPVGPGLIGFFNTSPSISSNGSIGNEMVFLPQGADLTSYTAVTTYINGDLPSEYNTNASNVVKVCFKSSLEPNQFGVITFQAQNDSSNITLSYASSCP
ncbi:MAG TPA: prepilin-type N-terminal cleavage/methylation domain-containing protein [Candidatus Saccharimonadia bacterium]|nr:prepilin-type N-terminal cleavage/methylation domain-containing protein [Candidatus Saccharimonadia bacterium]